MVMKLVEGPLAAVASGFAVLFSGFTLWETTLQSSDLRVFVPPVIYYAGHQPNTTVEALKIPVTLVNEGAQTGAVLSLTLTVSDQAGRSKTFYSASTVPDQGAPAPFTPIVLEGHSSKSALLLFYTRGAAETVEQIIGAPGSYKFTLTLDEGRSQGGLFNLLGPKDATKLGFARALPSYDARMDAMPLYAENWQSSVSGESK